MEQDDYRTSRESQELAGFRQFVTRDLKVYAYANSQAGHGQVPLIKSFWAMWEKKQ
jgi:hypothetical protein